jgi:hypothetical protein
VISLFQRDFQHLLKLLSWAQVAVAERMAALVAEEVKFVLQLLTQSLVFQRYVS